MKHLKKFENFNEPVNEDLFGFLSLKDKSAYNYLIEFLEGDSEEAKKIKEIYEKNFVGKSNDEIGKDKNLLDLMQKITRMGAKWAIVNKKTQKDYTFKQIQTVMEENFSRKFRGGGASSNVVGESKKHSREEMLDMLHKSEKCKYGKEELKKMSTQRLEKMCKNC